MPSCCAVNKVINCTSLKSWNEGQRPQVMLLDGPFEGITWPALELLPYNPKTGNACHERGECVMVPGGEIIPGKTNSDDG